LRVWAAAPTTIKERKRKIDLDFRRASPPGSKITIDAYDANRKEANAIVASGGQARRGAKVTRAPATLVAGSKTRR
jgi:hypothetical protein